MGELGETAVRIFQYLLPGFLMAWVFYGLTSHPKPSQFERVIQALIFTLIVQAAIFLEKMAVTAFWPSLLATMPHETKQLLASTVSAFFLGLVFSFAANSDCFHALARKLSITRETSYPSEWFGAFLKNVTYVVLHLQDERRIYGWPKDWPSDPTRGHFVLQQPSWLDGIQETPIIGVSCVLIAAQDVKWVEFMEKN
ncbi:MAG TPA: DUF6338 family protein [Rhizomicrobium sp.]|nr:DUF6338 family protein [Rhizomicrobium sp.]